MYGGIVIFTDKEERIRTKKTLKRSRQLEKY